MLKFFFVSCFIVMATRLLSCDCPPVKLKSPGYLDKFHLIFRARADSVILSGSNVIVWFAVLDLFKGTSPRICPVYLGGEGSCQLRPERGDEWIIYASYQSFGKPFLDYCSPSRKQIADKTQDFNTINNGLSYQDELAFLKSVFGVHAAGENRLDAGSRHDSRLIHPDPDHLLYWLAASILGFLTVFVLLRKFMN
jgi:hypothetical protein